MNTKIIILSTDELRVNRNCNTINPLCCLNYIGGNIINENEIINIGKADVNIPEGVFNREILIVTDKITRVLRIPYYSTQKEFTYDIELFNKLEFQIEM